jgi:ankyrin repeat protein
MIAAAQSAPTEGSIFVPSSTRALMVAASQNNAPMIGLLLQAGANPGAKNDRGETAVDIAKLNGNQEAAQAISVLGKAFSGTEALPPAEKAEGSKG